MDSFSGKIFENKTSLEIAEYNECKFINCDFSEQRLSNISLSECEFENCNLSNSKLDNSSFKEVVFTDCKLMGLNFDSLNQFLLKMKFENCQLDYSSFYKLKIPKTQFNNCSITEVEFTNTNLTEALFKECDLSNSIFENTILEKANLYSALNYNINPSINSIKKASFSQEGIAGLLDSFDIVISR